MRKAAKARDDVVVANGEVEIFVKGWLLLSADKRNQLSEIFYGALLMLNRFGMLERQIKKHSFNRSKLQIQSLIDSIDAQRQSFRVISKSARRIPINVSRKLIGKQNQRQSAGRY